MADSHRTHGVLSILIFLLAVALADAVLFYRSPVLGWSYIGVVLVGLWGIITSFCTKCCCKHRCSHVVLGWIARYLPKRPVGKYTARDVTGMAVSFSAVALFPQPWIWSVPVAAAGFWLLAAVVVLDIAKGVCPGCANTLCPFHPKPSS